MQARQLAKLRARMESFMTLNCTVLRPANVSDGAGGYIANPADTTNWEGGQTIPCSLTLMRPKLADEQAAQGGQRLAIAEEWVVALPLGTSINAGDQLQINAQVYEVNNVLVHQYPLCTSAAVKEVR